jgi:hypothetical protein
MKEKGQTKGMFEDQLDFINIRIVIYMPKINGTTCQLKKLAKKA